MLATLAKQTKMIVALPDEKLYLMYMGNAEILIVDYQGEITNRLPIPTDKANVNDARRIMQKIKRTGHYINLTV